MSICNLKKGSTLVAAVSGGVDSSTAAAIMKKEGYNIIGVTLRLKSCDTTTEKRKSCCSIDDDLQASASCSMMNIPHYFIDGKDDFDLKVLNYSWEEYRQGHTPNPCIKCNLFLKWGTLLDYALNIGADGIITGHYAKIVNEDFDGKNISLLKRGEDTKKDQSYFLAFLTQEQLSKTYFPLGEMDKPTVRKYADELNLPNSKKEESQDACFGFAGEPFSETLRKRYDGKIAKGNFIDKDGKILGQHNGIHLYTIGQRKGLRIALGKPAYVQNINTKNNEITLTIYNKDLMLSSLIAENINWQNPKFKTMKSFKCQAQIRYCHNPADATVTNNNDGTISINFEKPQRAITPGQAVVFYDNDIVIGGGWIK